MDFPPVNLDFHSVCVCASPFRRVQGILSGGGVDPPCPEWAGLTCADPPPAIQSGKVLPHSCGSPSWVVVTTKGEEGGVDPPPDFARVDPPPVNPDPPRVPNRLCVCCLRRFIVHLTATDVGALIVPCWSVPPGLRSLSGAQACTGHGSGGMVEDFQPGKSRRIPLAAVVFQ